MQEKQEPSLDDLKIVLFKLYQDVEKLQKESTRMFITLVFLIFIIAMIAGRG